MTLSANAQHAHPHPAGSLSLSLPYNTHKPIPCALGRTKSRYLSRNLFRPRFFSCTLTCQRNTTIHLRTFLGQTASFPLPFPFLLRTSFCPRQYFCPDIGASDVITGYAGVQNIPEMVLSHQKTRSSTLEGARLYFYRKIPAQSAHPGF